jgi:hypothetical protein
MKIQNVRDEGEKDKFRLFLPEIEVGPHRTLRARTPGTDECLSKMNSVYNLEFIMDIGDGAPRASSSLKHSQPHKNNQPAFRLACFGPSGATFQLPTHSHKPTLQYESSAVLNIYTAVVVQVN